MSSISKQATREELQADLAEALKPFGYTVEGFLATPIDDLTTIPAGGCTCSLRDMWLICKGIL